jgi:branched-chain amino acid transport system permease protein
MKGTMKFLSNKGLLNLLLIMIAFVLPLVVKDKYWMHIFILMCIWSISALSLNLIMGYTGQANLAMGGFFGIGSYTTALLMLKMGVNFWPALLAGALLASIIGFLIGIPLLRTKGSYFAIGTLCFNVIILITVERWESLTEGARGVMGIPPPPSIVLPFGLTINFSSLAAMYYLMLVFLLLTIFIFYRVVHSLVGRGFMAVRESEDLTNSIGINPATTKLLAFVASIFLSGIAGGLYAVYIGFLDPEIAGYHLTFEVLLFVMIGGIGTISGPIVGAIVVTLLGEALHFLDAFRLIAYGLVLVLVIIFMPQGMVGGIQSLRAKLLMKKS